MQVIIFSPQWSKTAPWGSQRMKLSEDTAQALVFPPQGKTAVLRRGLRTTKMAGEDVKTSSHSPVPGLWEEPGPSPTTVYWSKKKAVQKSLKLTFSGVQNVTWSFSFTKISPIKSSQQFRVGLHWWTSSRQSFPEYPQVPGSHGSEGQTRWYGHPRDICYFEAVRNQYPWYYFWFEEWPAGKASTPPPPVPLWSQPELGLCDAAERSSQLRILCFKMAGGPRPYHITQLRLLCQHPPL